MAAGVNRPLLEGGGGIFFIPAHTFIPGKMSSKPPSAHPSILQAAVQPSSTVITSDVIKQS